MTGKVVDLDALSSPDRQGGVSVGGVTYPVRPLSHTAAHRIAVAHEGDVASAIVASMRDGARESVPSMPDDVFAALSMEQVISIVAISRGGADAVEELIAEYAAGQQGKA